MAAGRTAVRTVASRWRRCSQSTPATATAELLAPGLNLSRLTKRDVSPRRRSRARSSASSCDSGPASAPASAGAGSACGLSPAAAASTLATRLAGIVQCLVKARSHARAMSLFVCSASQHERHHGVRGGAQQLACKSATHALVDSTPRPSICAWCDGDTPSAPRRH